MRLASPCKEASVRLEAVELGRLLLESTVSDCNPRQALKSKGICEIKPIEASAGTTRMFGKKAHDGTKGS